MIDTDKFQAKVPLSLCELRRCACFIWVAGLKNMLAKNDINLHDWLRDEHNEWLTEWKWCHNYAKIFDDIIKQQGPAMEFEYILAFPI